MPRKSSRKTRVTPPATPLKKIAKGRDRDKTKRPDKLDQALDSLSEEWNRSREKEPTDNPYHLEPGIHLDIPFEDYIRIPAINQSSLSDLKKSPAHYRYSPRREPTPALRFGSIVHEGHLEPQLLATKYIVVPEETFASEVQTARVRAGEDPYKNVKATKAYKELCREYLLQHPGKLQVSLAWFTNVAKMLKNLDAHPVASKLFDTGHPEVTIIWSDRNNRLCKGRIDWLTSDSNGNAILVDLKTTEDATSWTVDKWDYHIQCAFYLRGYAEAYKQLTPAMKSKFPKIPTDPSRSRNPLSHGLPPSSFYFCVVEKTPPYTVRIAPPDRSTVLAGHLEFTNLLDLIHTCHVNKRWPHLPSPDSWELSRWYNVGDFPSHVFFPDTGAFTDAQTKTPRDKSRVRR